MDDYGKILRERWTQKMITFMGADQALNLFRMRVRTERVETDASWCLTEALREVVAECAKLPPGQLAEALEDATYESSALLRDIVLNFDAVSWRCDEVIQLLQKHDKED